MPSTELTALPTDEVFVAVLRASGEPGTGRLDNIRRVVEEALVRVRTEAFADGQAHAIREVHRALQL